MKEQKRVTIKDVAKATGMSTAAVSHALRPRENSTIKLQAGSVELIRETARRLNYRPHAGARSIRSRRFGSVGYLSSSAHNLVYSPYGYQQGVHDALEANDFRVTLIRVSSDLTKAREQLPKAFAELNLDALVVESYSYIANLIYETYEGWNLPFLYLNDRHKENSVYVDEMEGGAVLTQHVLKKGYQKVAFVHRLIEGEGSVENMHHSAKEREGGYSAAMIKAGLMPEIKTVVVASPLGRDLHLSDSQWDSIKDYDALIAYDDDLANLIAQKAYTEGCRIPDDLGIAGFNGDYASFSSWIPLTTMEIPSYEMGVKIGEMAVQRISAPQEPIPSVQFVPKLIEGGTL